jgi:glycerophosphoryl diester phosphodiesterase
MELIKNLIRHLLEIKIELLNILVLFILFMSICSLIKNKVVRMIFSILTGLIVMMQLTSIYFVRSLIGYQFYVHFNARDILGMIPIYALEIILFIVLLAFIIFFNYHSKIIFFKAKRLLIQKLPQLRGLFYKKLNFIITFLLIFTSLIVLNFNKGIIPTSSELFKILNSEEKEFKEALNAIGMNNYITPDNLKVNRGKNIIIISLESLEKGYLSDKMSHLTPNLRALKKSWNYYDMKENSGGGWTNGSLYTYLTGFPAYFNVIQNSIFQKAYHSNITGISHVFKKSGYKMTFITADAQFAGTQEMLHTFKVNHIIDKAILGSPVHDKDLFESAKIEIQSNILQNTPFVLFISTLDTHSPNGIYDKSMEAFVSPKESNLEFTVSSVDYLIGDFIEYLKHKNILSNTIVYIFPDHLKMGNPMIFDGTGERNLYLLTNANKNDITFNESNYLNQIDLPKIILNGSKIDHNSKFLTEYISGYKNQFILNNIEKITTLNTSGILRMSASQYKPPVMNENYLVYKNDKNRFIAHAGGMIDKFIYTNSLEALNLNYERGFRLFELDIIKTSDGQFVAAHDWEHWADIVSFNGNLPISKEEFLKHRIYGKFTPMDINRINLWFKEHKDAILITDKVNQPKAFSELFIDKNRLMMELFSLDAVKEGIKVGIKSAIPSQNVIEDLWGNKVKKLKQLGISNIAISRNFIESNVDLLIELKENNIKAYVYHVGFDIGKDEEYVVKYEMDYIYGLYADKWNFK